MSNSKIFATAALLSFSLASPSVGRKSGVCTWIPEGPLHSEWETLRQRECTRLIDDTSKSWAPWSYKPTCATAKEPVDGVTGRYCVYTHNSVRGTSGLSILSTPEIAAELTSYLEDLDPAWLHPQGRPYHVSLSTGDAGIGYEVRDIPGKGKGVIATRKIKAGEVIVRELPAVINMVELPKGIVADQVAPMFDLAVEQLPVKERTKVLSMARSAGGDSHHINDIFNTNGFGINVGPQRLTTLAPAVARINHSCRPNAFTRYSANTLTLEAVAYDDIEAGTEVTISYLPLNLLSEDRKAMIARWKFTCTCPLCSSEVEMAKSDINKGRVQAILDELKVEKGRTMETVAVLIKELEDITKAERLESQNGGFASILAGMYFQMLDLDKAKAYAAKAIREFTHYAGHDTDKVESAKEMAAFLDGVMYYNMD